MGASPRAEPAPGERSREVDVAWRELMRAMEDVHRAWDEWVRGVARDTPESRSALERALECAAASRARFEDALRRTGPPVPPSGHEL